jgi:hypothetical protein
METFPAAKFASIFGTLSVGELAYDDPDLPLLGSRLFHLNGVRRHALLRDLLRELDETEYHPSSSFDDGTGGGVDWVRDGKRVSLRTSMLKWSSSARTAQWIVKFQGVKFGQFDELFLAICTPEGVHVCVHDGSLGVSSAGRLTPRAGQVIQIYGSEHIRGWRAAFELFILPKLEGRAGCTVLGAIPYDDPRLAALAAKAGLEGTESASGTDTPVLKAYAAAPLAACSPRVRGQKLEALALAVDRERHPASVFSSAGEDGSAQPAGWTRDGARVLCRTAQLSWQKSHHRWGFTFSGIPLPVSARDGQSGTAQSGFEELQLVLYTPNATYIYRHDLSLGLQRSGWTDPRGLQLRLQGPRNEASWQAALELTILPKLDESRCVRLALVPF